MLSDHTPTPTLPTADPERSRAFYEGVLGFTPGEDAVGGLFYPSGDARFFVYPSAYAGTNKATALSFELPADAFDEVSRQSAGGRGLVRHVRGRGTDLERRRRGDG